MSAVVACILSVPSIPDVASAFLLPLLFSDAHLVSLHAVVPSVLSIADVPTVASVPVTVTNIPVTVTFP
jgi:hypothetical protein